MSDLIYDINKSASVIDELLLQHKNLVYYMLRISGQLNNPDAESAAWEALWDAINTFDVFSKNTFSTYACVIIRNAINSVLRKQQIEHKRQTAIIEYTENNRLLYSINAEDTELISTIDTLFDQYVNTKAGITKNILLVWYSSQFNTSVTNIAIACSCTPSYVSRVQCSFRAFISGKLKDI